MKSKKSFLFLLGILLLTACTQKNDDQIVGKWKYERMVVSELNTSGDSVELGMAHMVYEGTVLAFYQNDSFAMINGDTTSDFQGKGTYNFNAGDNTLTLHGGIKTSPGEKMKVAVKELTADSLKLGNVKELLIYSRVKE